MSDKATLLVIDDDPIQRALAVAALEDDYRVIEGESGEGICARVAEEKPSLVLLDIVMPGIDGYAACRALREDWDVGETPVLFLSAQVELEDRLKAYEAGGEDFIGKPFDPVELNTKVALTLKKVAERLQLKSNAQDAFTTAMTAMTSASELGIVIHALRQSFTADTLPALAEVTLAATRDFGLDACLRLVTSSSGALFCSQSGEATPVERSVLQQLALGDRIQSLRRQSAYNYGGVTLLIRNMPVEDEERMGRLRDNLALLAEGVEGRLRALDDRFSVQQEQNRQKQLAERTVAALNDIEVRHKRQRAEAEIVLHTMLDKVERSFLSLGLTESQEDAVSTLLRDAVHSIFELYDQGLAIESHMQSIRLAES